MIVQITTTATLEVPEGTRLEGERTLILPNGERLKAWVSMELNEKRDLNCADLHVRDCSIEHGDASVQEIEP